MPKSAPLSEGSFISVYLIATDVGEHALCALTPEEALTYRKKLATLKAAEPPAPPPQDPPPPAPEAKP